MALTITQEALFDILGLYEQIGFMQAIKAYEPTMDLVRETELKGWLRMLKVDQKQFKALVEHGQIKPHRLGSAKNSPKYYSKQEIKSALARNKVFVLIRESELSNINS